MSSIPQELLSKLTKKELAWPTLKEIVERALKDGNVSGKDKERFEALQQSGYLNKEVETIDEVIEKQIDEYITAEFDKSRKLGYLPPPQKMPKLSKLKKKYGKSKK